jgi:hypothetical protein
MRAVLVFFLIGICIFTEAQIVTRVTSDSRNDDSDKNKSISDSAFYSPDTRRPDIPFIDYSPAMIYLSENDSIEDHAYIRRNFTDQMVSVWSKPGRYYPASKIYGLRMNGKFYRSVMVNPVEFVFAEKAVSGRMSLYIYPKITQANGWVECFSSGGYTNNMIIENRSFNNKLSFGYLVTLEPEDKAFKAANDLDVFAEKYLLNLPETYKMAAPFLKMKNYQNKKRILAASMLAGAIGAAFIDSDIKWVFLAGFPAAAVLTFLNRKHIPGWEDMVKIVSSYNRESGGRDKI